ncbi:MAG: ATP-binding cassette domain-containing protein [Magnetococcus sp. DMHC-6]
MKIIEIKALSKKYFAKTVVDNIYFHVSQGECFGILGPNGAGKSTTLRMIIGLTPIDCGELMVFGLPMYSEQTEVFQRLGVVAQEDGLDMDLSVLENLRVHGDYFRIPKALLQERVVYLLEFAQLTRQSDHSVRSLSGGMQRRLAIARALIAKPDLLVLDEPTTGLDPQARHLIWQRLRLLRESGVTLLLTTHYMEEAARLCDRLLVLDQGRILAMDSPRALIAQHVEPEVIEIRSQEMALDRDQFQELPGRVESVGDIVYCYTDRPCAVLERLQGRHDLIFLHRPANLEDVFLKLTGRELRD